MRHFKEIYLALCTPTVIINTTERMLLKRYREAECEGVDGIHLA
jgi:hypothetical protein